MTLKYSDTNNSDEEYKDRDLYEGVTSRQFFLSALSQGWLSRSSNDVAAVKEAVVVEDTKAGDLRVGEELAVSVDRHDVAERLASLGVGDVGIRVQHIVLRCITVTHCQLRAAKGQGSFY